MLKKITETPSESWSFADLIRELPVPQEQAGQIRATQLSMIARMSIVMVLANLLNCAVILLSFRNTGADMMLTIWGFGMVLVSGAAFLSHLRERKKVHLKERSEKSIEQFAPTSASFSSRTLLGVPRVLRSS